MIKRNILSELIEWNKKNNDPLMLIGARQTGKTFILDYFCRTYFENYIYINLESNPNIIDFFKTTLDPERIISDLEAFFEKKIDFKNTIIFIDEIQYSEEVINSLKYFSEANKKYKIVCAGSLLGVKLNRMQNSFPVGKVIIKHLYPVTFDEFLIATNNIMLKAKIEDCFNTDSKMSTALHEKAIRLYQDYIYVGGMPRAITNYIENDCNIIEFDTEILFNLNLSYIADMSKYTKASEIVKINAIYKSMVSQLARDKVKFSYKLVDGYSEKKQLRTSIEWLLDASLLLRCTNINTPKSPLKAYENNNLFKLYFSDTGLLCNIANITPNEVINNNLGIFSGSLVENYVAITLSANGYNLNYWTSKSQAELDFIIKKEENIIPIEVKNSTNVKSKSLSSYQVKYEPKYSIRISLKNFGFENNIKSVPLYAAYMI